MPLHSFNLDSNNSISASAENVNSKDVSLLKYVPGYKTGDTADRINGLERPKPNEGYALQNGISINSISDSAAKVKVKSSDRDTTAATGSIPIKDSSRLHDRWRNAVV